MPHFLINYTNFPNRILPNNVTICLLVSFIRNVFLKLQKARRHYHYRFTLYLFTFICLEITLYFFQPIEIDYRIKRLHKAKNSLQKYSGFFLGMRSSSYFYCHFPAGSLKYHSRAYTNFNKI